MEDILRVKSKIFREKKMFNLIDLTDKKIIIAGASQGIGRDTAVMLSRLGAKLVLLARNEKGLQETLSMCGGEGHSYYLLDINNIDNIEHCVKEIISCNGAVDGLVYCSGITNDRPLNLFKPAVVEDVFRVNLVGFIEMVRCLTKKNRYNSGMRIVGISSTAGLKGTRAHLAYSASKAGMNGAMRCMAVELAAKGIAANTVAPGMIATDMYNKFLEESGGENSAANLGLLARQYLGIGETKDVASAIAFLISPAAKFITGICLPVDGGLTSC